jgi:hypothetical protein
MPDISTMASILFCFEGKLIEQINERSETGGRRKRNSVYGHGKRRRQDFFVQAAVGESVGACVEAGLRVFFLQNFGL